MPKVLMGTKYYTANSEFIAQTRAIAESRMEEIAVAGAQSRQPLTAAEKTELGEYVRAVINAYAALASRRFPARGKEGRPVIGFALDHDAKYFEDVVDPALLRILPQTMSLDESEVAGC